MTHATDRIIEVERRIRDSAAALGAALQAVHVYVEPAVARSVQAEHNLYDRIRAEFGLLTSSDAGRRMGSRATAPRNLAATARRDGALVAIVRGQHLLFPAFQFDSNGRPRQVISDLRALAEEAGWSEAGIVQWLCGPTTYLDEKRPVDFIDSDPALVLETARQAWSVQW